MFNVQVRNQGRAPAATTRLRVYRSTDATITGADALVTSSPVRALAASGGVDMGHTLIAPSAAGTYYYGACVDGVSGESDTRNNCSSGVRVRVSVSEGIRYGAIAFGWKGESCEDGYAVGTILNRLDRNSAITGAEAACRKFGGRNCRQLTSFVSCGAMAYGESSSGCQPFGGSGATRSAAEQDALATCRTKFSDCRIPVLDHGNRPSHCNTGAGAANPADG